MEICSILQPLNVLKIIHGIFIVMRLVVWTFPFYFTFGGYNRKKQNSSAWTLFNRVSNNIPIPINVGSTLIIKKGETYGIYNNNKTNERWIR